MGDQSRTITTNLKEIRRTLREHYEPLYANKLDNLHETDKVLKRHNLPKLTHEEMEHEIRSIKWKETELGINTHKEKPEGFQCELYQIFKEEK